jgi:hypothetical protein
VILNTLDYKQKMAALLEDPAYRKLTKDLTESVERKTRLLLKKSSLPEEVWKRPCPTGSRTPRLYGLPKIHKQGVPLRPIVSNIGAPMYHLAKHLAGLLNLLIGHSEYHVKNSIEFIHVLQTLHVGPDDIMVSFDVASLFTNVPILESLALLGRHFTQDIVTLFKHVLTSTYFICDGQPYEQTDGVAMGSPFSPVIANFFTEDFEERALDKATHKPSCWYHYVDDTFVIWRHGVDKLKTLEFLNSIHSTKEMEEGNHLPFLDIDVYRRLDGTLGHRVYRKPHMDLYLHPMFHHHQSNKHAVFATLVFRARAICDEDRISKKNSLRENGCSLQQIQQVLSSKCPAIWIGCLESTTSGELIYPQRRFSTACDR